MNQKRILSSVAVATFASTIAGEIGAAQEIRDRMRLIPGEHDACRVVKEAHLPALLAHADDPKEFGLAYECPVCMPSRQSKTDPDGAARRPTPQLSLE
jgi:hypothetical protein